MSKRTKLPWRTKRLKGLGYPATGSIEPNICEMVSSRPPGEVTANAEFIVLAVNSHEALLQALLSAVSAAEYVIKLCEDDVKAGMSSSPYLKSNPSAALAHCYAAMIFVGQARAAIAKSKKEDR